MCCVERKTARAEINPVRYSPDKGGSCIKRGPEEMHDRQECSIGRKSDKKWPDEECVRRTDVEFGGRAAFSWPRIRLSYREGR